MAVDLHDDGAGRSGASRLFSVIENGRTRQAEVGASAHGSPKAGRAREVGWGLGAGRLGQGAHATEGASAAIGLFAWTSLAWMKVIHTIDPANTGSIKVRPKRLGSRGAAPGQGSTAL